MPDGLQNSQNRDAAAMQAKLDELLRALESARVGFIGIERLTEGEIERLRDALEQESGNAAGMPPMKIEETRRNA